MSAQRVLIVDDDIFVGQVIRNALEDQYEVNITTSALNAYKHLSKSKIDLVLLDIKMPGINGLEALWDIKKIHPDTIIIMLSGYDSADNKQQARTLGAYGFISKPFEIDELRSYVDRVLSQ